MKTCALKALLTSLALRAVVGEGVVIFKDRIFGLFNYVEQNGYLKILIVCDWGNGGHERGVSYPSITF